MIKLYVKLVGGLVVNIPAIKGNAYQQLHVLNTIIISILLVLCLQLLGLTNRQIPLQVLQHNGEKRATFVILVISTVIPAMVLIKLVV